MPNHAAIGVTVNAGAVEAVELTVNDGRPFVRRSATEPLPAGVFSDGVLADADAVAKAVRRLLKRLGLRRSRPLGMFVAMSGRRTIARVVELSAASPEEAERTLQDRIAGYAVYEDREVIWQAAPHGEGDAGRQVYLTAAGAAEEISRLLQALDRAGVRVGYVEPHALAATRAMTAYETQENPPPTVFVNFGGDTAEFLIAKGDRALLIRSVEVGGGASAATPDDLESLLVEAERSVEYCRSRFQGEAPRVWVQAATDGDEQVAAFVERLTSRLPDVTVAVAPPWPAETGEGEAGGMMAPSWAAVGAAMAAAGRPGAVPLLNLVPAEWPRIQKVRRQVLGFASSVAAALVVSCAVTVLLRLSAGDLVRRVQAASVQMHRNTTEVLAAAELKHRAASAVERAHRWNRARSQLAPFDWVAGLEAVTDLTPPGVRLRKMEYRRGVLRITGEARTADDAHEFVRRLASLRLLDEAKMGRLERAPAADRRPIQYTILCRFQQKSVPEPAPDAKGTKP